MLMAVAVNVKVLFWQKKNIKIVAEITFSKLSRATETGIIVFTSVTVWLDCAG